jgi:hypothetical protein
VQGFECDQLYSYCGHAITTAAHCPAVVVERVDLPVQVVVERVQPVDKGQALPAEVDPYSGMLLRVRSDGCHPDSG